MLTYFPASEKDYSVLTNIWSQSVLATHNFLKAEDKDDIQKMLPEYFKQVDLLKWQLDESIVGFSGTANQELVMLFLDPKYFRKGYGHQILQKLIDDGINKVSVNEQNVGAFNFYKKNGFKMVSRSDLDSDDRPYPILNLQL